MKALERDLKSVVKSLKLLTTKTEKIVKQLDMVKNVPRAKKPITKTVKKTTAKKNTSRTATDTVLSIIKKQKKGIDTAELKKKTNFDIITIRNIVFRLKKQGKIRTKTRGFYVVA